MSAFLLRNTTITAILALSAVAAGAADDRYPASPYMGAAAERAIASNGAITNRKLLDGIAAFNWLEPTIENPAEGVWVFGGYGLAPMSIIEAKDGLIAFDTGDTRHDGEMMLAATRTVTQKPIKVIIYGHSHTVAGAGVLAEGRQDVMVIGHPGLNDVVGQNLAGGGAPAYFPEVGPYLTARALTQFNAYMPREGPDAYVVPTNLTAVDLHFLPVNRPVQDGLHVRRAVAEYVPVPDRYAREPDLVLAMSGETWASLYLSHASVADLIQGNHIRVSGDPAEAVRLVELFDRYRPEKAVVIPPAFLEHAH